MHDTQGSKRRARASHLINLLSPKPGHMHVSPFFQFASLRIVSDAVNLHQRSVKIGTISQTPAQLLANLESALPAIAQHIPDGWDNLQVLHIKTSSSVALPIWTCGLEQRWEGASASAKVPVATTQAGKGAVNEDEDEEEEEQVVTPSIQERPSKKRKELVADDDEVTQKPAKKTKAKTSVGDTSTREQGSTQISEKKTRKGEVDQDLASISSTKRSKNSEAAHGVETPSTGHIRKPSAHKSLSREEVKQKRAAAGGVDREKKKEKLATTKAGKSAKDKLLGKKAGRLG